MQESGPANRLHLFERITPFRQGRSPVAIDQHRNFDKNRPNEVHIRFRYDKSPTNFSVRKFKTTGHHFSCPCLASIAIFYRAELLQVPTGQPIRVFCKPSQDHSGFRFLSDNDVTSELRATCRRTYPDPNHYMHQHILCIMAHSVRVTACVALHSAGESEFVIAFRLRWTVQSVMHYIRDCSQHVGDLCQAVLSGAGRL